MISESSSAPEWKRRAGGLLGGSWKIQIFCLDYWFCTLHVASEESLLRAWAWARAWRTNRMVLLCVSVVFFYNV